MYISMVTLGFSTLFQTYEIHFEIEFLLNKFFKIYEILSGINFSKLTF